MGAWNPSTPGGRSRRVSGLAGHQWLTHALPPSPSFFLSPFPPSLSLPLSPSIFPSLSLYLPFSLSILPSYKDIFQTKLDFKLRTISRPPQSRAPSDVPTAVMTATAETRCWYTSRLLFPCHLTIRHPFVSCCSFLIPCSNVRGSAVFRVLQLKLSIEK